jgi:AraC-like DNA-binding protein
MLLNEIKPSFFLTEYIRLYRIVDFHFPASISLPFKVYPPRPEHCLQFYPKDTERVEYTDKNLIIADKKVTLLGQHTTVNHRYVGREFLVIQVVFQPGALYKITGIPSVELTNAYMDAEEIMGTGTRFVNEQLFSAKSYAEMIQVVECYLSHLIKKAKPRQHSIDSVSQKMLQHGENFSVNTFLKEACLSHRQFDRKFLERVGITPKQYLQVIRFDRAFRMKNRCPEKDWLTIALHCGYYDYQHLVRDYKEFTGCTPNKFLQVEDKAPERTFGDKEI